MGKERGARIPHEEKGGGKDSVVGKLAISSSPPPCHLLELLLSETDLPAALHSTRDKHPESKQGGRGPVPSALGAERERPELPRPPPGLPGGEGCARPWHRSTPGTARGMASGHAEPSQGH